jgi:hypothetical protein
VATAEGEVRAVTKEVATVVATVEGVRAAAREAREVLVGARAGA